MTKISNLPQDTAPSGDDFVPTLETTSGQTNKVLLSDIGEYIGSYPQNPYKFSAWRSTALTPNGAYIIFNTELFDTNSNYDTSNGKYTVPVTGYYQINAWVTYNVTAAPQDPSIMLKKNNATDIGYAHYVNMYNGASNGSVCISTLVSLTAGDYIQVQGVTNGAMIVSSQTYNGFNGFLVSVT